jgi:hypothetical protein
MAAAGIPPVLLPAYSSTTGKITEMMTGKTMIEYQTFF